MPLNNRRLFKNQYSFFVNQRSYLFIFGCVGLTCRRWAFSRCEEWGLLTSCSAWASHSRDLLVAQHCSRHSGFNSCGSQALEHDLSSVAPGLFAWWHMGSSWARDQTHVPCIGRSIFNHDQRSP